MSEALIQPVGSGTVPKKLYAMGAEFASPAELVAAAGQVRAGGYRWWDCYSPYAVHGLDQAMGLKKSWVGLITLCGGLAGLTASFLLQTITSVYVYPLTTQGKPFFSLPAFVPILDLLMIIGATVSAIGGMTTLNLLPRLHHPLWEWSDFAGATHNRFFVVIEASDPRFEPEKTADLLRSLGGTNLTFIGREE